MKNIIKSIFAISFSFLLFGCGAVGAKEAYDYNEQGQEETTNNVVTETNRKIIYTASYTITSDNMQNIKASVTNHVNEIEGYTEASEETETYAKLIYKIPTEKLNAFLDYMDALEGVGKKQISSEDVTSTYSTLDARLTTLKASKASYVKLLEEETLSYNDIIAIQDKIADIDTEILKYQLEKDSYDNKLSYSSVTVYYYTTSSYSEPSWFDEYFEYLGEVGVGFINFITYSLPFALIFGGIFSAIFFPIHINNKKRRERNKNK